MIKCTGKLGLSFRERSSESSGRRLHAKGRLSVRALPRSGWLRGEGALPPAAAVSPSNRRRFKKAPASQIFALVLLAALHTSSNLFAGEIREAQVAGGFYPADPAELEHMIDGFLDKVPHTIRPEGTLAALIAPHAGYVYSGQVAAFAYKQVQGLEIDTVIVLGPFHRGLFEGASVWQAGSWKTPLGEVPVDSELASAILKESDKFKFIPQAHLGEHSIEVQIPFLQRVLKNFKIVPIAVSDDSLDNCRLLARAIFNAIQGKKVLMVVSTDMSHYHPDEKAQTMDHWVLDRLVQKDAEGLWADLSSRRGELCGSAGVLTLLEIAKLMGDTGLQVLQYANSGDVTGDKKAVVGYGASVLYKKTTGENTDMLNPEQQKELLKIARQTIETYLTAGKMPDIPVSDPVLKEKRAVFVTLREHGELRGCIGNTVATEPLYLAVQDMAIQSALHDPRFMPLRKEEVKDLSIEISVLGLPQKVKSSDEIVMGKHGVIVSRGGRSGLFLPKVAEETGWSKEEFLSELCSQKAGLPADAWKDSSTSISVFTAQDFGEKS